MKNTDQARMSLIDAILIGEREQANRVLDDYAALIDYRAAMNDILEPVLEDIGNRWAEESISLAQGYIAGKVAEDMLLKIHDAGKETTDNQAVKGPVVVGNIEDDYHSLGRKLVSVFLQSAGWVVHDLGNDVTAEEFVDKAVETGSRVIGVSAMMYTTAGNIRKVRNELVKRNLSGKIQLAVGGAVFKQRPELASEVGGDGTASSCFKTPALFDELWGKSLREVPS
jgi:methylmalonyl-CoA mutase cobalamin-binding domain/chain